MLNTVTLSSKNQITLPKYILDLLRIKSGEKLLVETQEDSIKIDAAKKGIPYRDVLTKTKTLVAKKLAGK